MLIEKGAKVDGATKNSETPLCYAAWEGHLEVARYLIEKGASVNPNCGYTTPLFNSIRGDHYKVAELLISKGAAVNVRGEHGYTPLHTAVEVGDAKLVQLLLAHGADINARLPDTTIPVGHFPEPVVKGKTALGLALQLKKNYIADVLRKRGAVEQ